MYLIIIAAVILVILLSVLVYFYLTNKEEPSPGPSPKGGSGQPFPGGSLAPTNPIPRLDYEWINEQLTQGVLERKESRVPEKTTPDMYFSANFPLSQNLMPVIL